MDYTPEQHAAIVHHTDQAHAALHRAAAYLEEVGRDVKELTFGEQMARKQVMATSADAATRLAQGHLRLLELKLAIGKPAF